MIFWASTKYQGRPQGYRGGQQAGNRDRCGKQLHGCCRPSLGGAWRGGAGESEGPTTVESNVQKRFRRGEEEVYWAPQFFELRTGEILLSWTSSNFYHFPGDLYSCKWVMDGPHRSRSWRQDRLCPSTVGPWVGYCLGTLSFSETWWFPCYRVDPKFATNGVSPLDVAKEQHNWRNCPEIAVLIYEAAGEELPDQFKVELLSRAMYKEDKEEFAKLLSSLSPQVVRFFKFSASSCI